MSNPVQNATVPTLPQLPAPGSDWQTWLRFAITVGLLLGSMWLGQRQVDTMKAEVQSALTAK